jgi:hypothetical protein
MTGQANFPTALDDNSSLYDVLDNVTAVVAAHHNNPKEAIKAIEAKIGVHHTTIDTSLDFRLGSATGSHRHDGASGQGLAIAPSTLLVPSGGFPSGLSVHDHLMDAGLHNPTALGATGAASAIGGNVIRVPSQAIQLGTGIASVISQSEATVLLFAPSTPIFRATGIASVVSQSQATVLFSVPTQVPRYIMSMGMVGSAIVGSNVCQPLVIGRTLQLESVQGALRKGPSGATSAFDVLVGPTSIYEASQGYRPIFPAGATAYRSAAAATPNLITYPSGAVITLDTDAVGSNDPGQDLRITFIFRE